MIFSPVFLFSSPLSMVFYISGFCPVCLLLSCFLFILSFILYSSPLPVSEFPALLLPYLDSGLLRLSQKSRSGVSRVFLFVSWIVFSRPFSLVVDMVDSELEPGVLAFYLSEAVMMVDSGW